MPAVSPGRFCRVVAETDMASCGSGDKSLREIVVFPAPEGEESTSIRPRRCTSTNPVITPRTPSLDILDLLAQLLDRRFELNAEIGQGEIGALRAQRIGFAVEFLAEEIELAAD